MALKEMGLSTTLTVCKVVLRCDAGASSLYDWLEHIGFMIGYMKGKNYILWLLRGGHLFAFYGVQKDNCTYKLF